jgi:hypothetical protein
MPPYAILRISAARWCARPSVSTRCCQIDLQHPQQACQTQRTPVPVTVALIRTGRSIVIQTLATPAITASLHDLATTPRYM